jgi:hypothetical protein
MMAIFPAMLTGYSGNWLQSIFTVLSTPAILIGRQEGVRNGGRISFPRMYLGLHYASDMVVGSLIGITIAWVLLRSELFQSIIARRVLATAETRPEWFYAVAFLISLEMATVFEGSRLLGRALLHAAMVELHLGVVHSGTSRPIDEWGGLLAMAGLLVTASYGASVLSRKLRRRANGINKSVVIHKL